MPTNFRQSVLADLVWAVTSPGLLPPDELIPTDAWFTDFYAPISKYLQSKDSKTDTEFLKFGSFSKLGIYFESLWKLALEHHPIYKLIAHNLPVRENGRTLGAFDFVVYNLIQNEYEHWEVAVKFYLGLKASANKTVWVGPGLKDRLDFKIEHMKQRQLQLSQNQIGHSLLQKKGISISKRRLILKGRLFYPTLIKLFINDLHPCHLSGSWITASNFLRLKPNFDRYRKLCKQQWLGVYPQEELSPVTESVILNLKNPLQIAQFNQDRKIEHIFVLPNLWLHQAKIACQLFSLAGP